MINVIGFSKYKIDKKSLVEKIHDILLEKEVNPSQHLNIAFVGRRKMRHLAASYKKEDVALPVLSFLYNENAVWGEIVICYPQAVLLAAEKNKRVDDMLVKLIKHAIDNLLK